jgi:hypothetical protein
MLIDEALELVRLVEENVGEGKIYRTQGEAAVEKGWTLWKFKSRLKTARHLLKLEKERKENPEKFDNHNPKEIYTTPIIPDGEKSIDEILDSNSRAFLRKKQRLQAKEDVNIKVEETYKGHSMPVGFVCVGDTHIDDPYADLPTLRKHLALIKEYPYVRTVLLGDHLNNWVGRLQAMYGESETSTHNAWRLVEWLIKESDPICIISGNHGAWSGSSDPVKWMQKPKNVIEDDWGIRMNFTFPNGKEFKIYNKHNFKGTSIYNKLHGLLRSAMFGAGRGAHVYVAGHLHIGSVMQTHLEDSAETVWLVRCRGYKYWDGYAHERLNIEFDGHSQGCESVFVYVDPNNPNPWGWVQCFADIESGLSHLNNQRAITMKRIDEGISLMEE